MANCLSLKLRRTGEYFSNEDGEKIGIILKDLEALHATDGNVSDKDSDEILKVMNADDDCEIHRIKYDKDITAQVTDCDVNNISCDLYTIIDIMDTKKTSQLAS